MGGDWPRRLNPGEDLSDADMRHCNGDLDRHMRGYTQAAVLVVDLALGVSVRGGYHSANHEQGNTQHAEKNSPRRSHARSCAFAQHPMTIDQVQGKWEETGPAELLEPDTVRLSRMREFIS